MSIQGIGAVATGFSLVRNLVKSAAHGAEICRNSGAGVTKEVIKNAADIVYTFGSIPYQILTVLALKQNAIGKITADICACEQPEGVTPQSTNETYTGTEIAYITAAGVYMLFTVISLSGFLLANTSSKYPSKEDILKKENNELREQLEKSDEENIKLKERIDRKNNSIVKYKEVIKNKNIKLKEYEDANLKRAEIVANLQGQIEVLSSQASRAGSRASSRGSRVSSMEGSRRSSFSSMGSSSKVNVLYDSDEQEAKKGNYTKPESFVTSVCESKYTAEMDKNRGDTLQRKSDILHNAKKGLQAIRDINNSYHDESTPSPRQNLTFFETVDEVHNIDNMTEEFTQVKYFKRTQKTSNTSNAYEDEQVKLISSPDDELQKSIKTAANTINLKSTSAYGARQKQNMQAPTALPKKQRGRQAMRSEPNLLKGKTSFI